jgi:hypothetical protein
MLLLNQGDTTGRIVCTLTEKVTIAEPFYVFVFTHVTTKAVVQWVQTFGNDTSPSPERYNEFLIPLSLFTNKATGQYTYNVFQSAVVNPATTVGLTLLENGKMLLEKSSGVTLTGHNPSATYTGYAG